MIRASGRIWQLVSHVTNYLYLQQGQDDSNQSHRAHTATAIKSSFRLLPQMLLQRLLDQVKPCYALSTGGRLLLPDLPDIVQRLGESGQSTSLCRIVEPIRE